MIDLLLVLLALAAVVGCRAADDQGAGAILGNATGARDGGRGVVVKGVTAVLPRKANRSGE